MKLNNIITTAISVFISVSAFAKDTPKQSTVSVIAVQLQSADVGNFDKIKALATKAKAQGAQLVIFPEGSVFGWLNPDVFTKAAPIPGKYSDQFSAIAKSVNIWLAAGLAEQGPKAGPGALKNAYQAYDSGVLINPQGKIVLHHRKYNVLRNAFDPKACQRILNKKECSYTPGPLTSITTTQPPFGKTSLLVCSDAYIYPPATALKKLKTLAPGFVIVPWGITAGTQKECGTKGFNATGYASEAAAFLKTAFVVGANALGARNYGKYLPSVYCGSSGYATPTGQSVEAAKPDDALALFRISKSFDAQAGPIWNNPDAKSKCPTTCSIYTSHWNGQWTTTVPGKMSVCGCVPGSIK